MGKRTCLVTGGCGFIGHHVVEHLLKHTEYNIIIIDKLSYASMGFNRLRAVGLLSSSQQSLDDRCRIFPYDLTSGLAQGFRHELMKWDIEMIIHMAAETHVDNSISDPVPFVSNNINSTLHVLEFARTLRGLQAFFYFSTDEVFGSAPVGFEGFKEEDSYNPTNPYSASKAGSELLCKSYFNTYKVPVIILNVMNAFGERQHPEKFIPLCIKKILKGEQLTIHAYPGSGSLPGSRFYIHARNIAAAVLFLLKNGIVGERYNVKGEKEVDNLELALAIGRIIGKPVNYKLDGHVETRPGHDVRYALDGSKMDAMGWKLPSDFHQSLENTVKWTLENPEWLVDDEFRFSKL